MMEDVQGSVPSATPDEVALARSIRSHRNAANMSHARLAKVVGYSRQYVSRAERAEQGLPSADLVAAIDSALNADGDLVALRAKVYQARLDRRRTRVESEASTGEVSTLDNTDLLNFAEGLPGLTSPGLIPILGPSGLHSALDSFVAGVVRRYEIEGPRLLLPEVLSARDLCSTLGDHVAANLTRSMLAKTAGQLAGILSYMCVNLSRFKDFERFALEASLMASVAGDRDLSAWVTATRSFAAYYGGDYNRALRYAESALEMTNGQSSQRARILSNGVARAAARLGDGDVVNRAVDEALAIAEHSGVPDVMTACIDFGSYGRVRTQANAATAYLSLGENSKVLSLTAQLTESLQRSNSRWSRSLVGTDEAMALVNVDPPRAAEIGLSAIAESQGSPITSISRRSAELADALKSYEGNRTVADFLGVQREWQLIQGS